MAKRTPRIEIKVVMPSGTLAYRHALGDEIAKSHGGGVSAGPSESDFAVACKAICHLAGITKAAEKILEESSELPSISAIIEASARAYAGVHHDDGGDISARLVAAYIAGASKAIKVTP